MKKLLYAIVGIGLFLAGAYSGARYSAWPFGTAQDLRATYKLIKTNHATGDVTDDALYYGAVRGMVDSMDDPYSRFLDPKEASAGREEMAGNFVGIGAEVGLKDERFTIVAPIADSPAAKAGLRADDVIVTVDGVSTDGKPVKEIIALIRGEKGTTVTLRVQRKGVKDAFDVRIVRDKVDSPSVKWRMVTENGKTITIVSISGFHDDTGALFKEAVGEATKAGSTGLILDLRNNPGGRLDMAGAIVCQWVSVLPYVIVEPKNEKPEKLRCGSGPALLAQMPTAILVNKNSASASEVTTGALQDYGKALVIGEQTYGKGCGQSIIDFPDGAQLALVTFLWKTPNGRSIHKVGITPDEVVKADADEIKKGHDAQLERAKAYLTTGH